jgi:hypothetical protein
MPSMTLYHPIPSNALYRVYEHLKNKFVKLDLDPEKVDENVNFEDLLSRRELRKMETIWTDIWGNVFKMFRPSRRYEYPKYFEMEQKLSSKDDKYHKNKAAAAPSEKEGGREQSKVNENDEPSPKDATRPYTDEQLSYLLQISKNLLENIDDSETSENGSEEDEVSAPTGSQPLPKRRKLLKDQRTEKECRRISLRDRKISDTRRIEIASCSRDPFSDIDIQTWNVRTAVMNMMFSNEDYGSVEAFFRTVSDTNLVRGLNSLRNEGVICITKPLKRFTLSLPMKRLLSLHLVPKTFKTANSLLSSLLRKDSTSARPYYNLGTLRLLSEMSPIVSC